MDEQDHLYAAKLAQLRQDVRAGLDSGPDGLGCRERQECWARQAPGQASRDQVIGWRASCVCRYVIFYAPLPDCIDVIRVLHPARDIDAVFDPDPDAPAS